MLQLPSSPCLPSNARSRQNLETAPCQQPLSSNSSVVIRIPRPARRRRLRAAISHRRGRAVVSPARAGRRRTRRGCGSRVGAPAARPGRGCGRVHRTGSRGIECARGRSVERRAGCGSSQATGGGRVVCRGRGAPGIVAGAWCRGRYSVGRRLGSCAPCRVATAAGVGWCLGAEGEAVVGWRLCA